MVNQKKASAQHDFLYPDAGQFSLSVPSVPICYAWLHHLPPVSPRGSFQVLITTSSRDEQFYTDCLSLAFRTLGVFWSKSSNHLWLYNFFFPQKMPYLHAESCHVLGPEVPGSLSYPGPANTRSCHFSSFGLVLCRRPGIYLTNRFFRCVFLS